jgi:hypothetical protein
MAGRACEVVSLAELRSVHRVGVRIHDSGAFDGIPLEALLPLHSPKASKAISSSSNSSGKTDKSRNSKAAWGSSETRGASPQNQAHSEPEATLPLPRISVSVSVSEREWQVEREVEVEMEELEEEEPQTEMETEPEPVFVAPQRSRGGKPRWRVRERGHGVSRFRGPSSTEIVEAFYRQALGVDRPKPASGAAPAELFETPLPVAPAPAWMSAAGNVKASLQQALPDTAVKTAEIPPLSASTNKVAKTKAKAKVKVKTAPVNVTQAQVDWTHAIYDLPPSSSGGGGAGAGRRKAAPVPERADSPVQSAAHVVALEFDEANALFDGDARKKGNGGGGRGKRAAAAASKLDAALCLGQDRHVAAHVDLSGADDMGPLLMAKGVEYRAAQEAQRWTLEPPPPESDEPDFAAVPED